MKQESSDLANLTPNLFYDQPFVPEVCTSHGVIWRNKPEQIVERYLDWADNYQENQISISGVPDCS
jgi:hypothetical protein